MRKFIFPSAMIASLLALMPVNGADAQQCTSDNSDNRGCGVVIEGPHSRAQREAAEAEASRGSSAPAERPRFPGKFRMVDTYYAVVFHPRAKEHWAVWKIQTSAQNAEERALSLCNAVMGRGCQIAGSGKNALVLTGYQMDHPSGPQFVDIGTGRNAREAKRDLAARCKAKGIACVPKAYIITGPETPNGGLDLSIYFDPSKQSLFGQQP